MTPEMRKISVDEVVRFCFEKFLNILKDGEHRNPFEVVRKAVMAEFGFDDKTAHSICRPPYWVLMDEKVMECYNKGGSTCWKLMKPDYDIDRLVKKTLGTDKKNGDYDYGPTMEARLRETV